jgi:repressor LexA
MDQALSEGQRKVFEAISRYLDDNDRPPSLEDIQRLTGLSSRANVKYHVDKLKEIGCIGQRAGSRGIFIVEPGKAVAPSVINTQIIGFVAAGLPIQVYQAPEDFFVSSGMARNGDFALRVKGESMIEDHVEDGDIVIVHSDVNPTDGDMVVALVLNDTEDTAGAATLKRFYREWPKDTSDRGRIRLEPRNPTMQPIYADPAQVKIEGKVVAVIRPVMRKAA